jgi:fatty-acyl-CoA synthase
VSFGETLGEALAIAAERFATVPAFHFHGRDMTYAEWHAASQRFARALLARGIGRGDRVAFLLPTDPGYLIGYLGCALVGAITVGISTRYRRHELRHILADAEPRLVVSVGSSAGIDFPALLQEVSSAAATVPEIVRFDGDGPGSLAAMLATGDRASVDLDAASALVTPDDPLTIVYTSGTTGPPKGAVYDSRAMTALTRLFSSRWREPPVPGAPSFWPGVSLTHVGATGRIHLQMASGGTLVLHDRFDAEWLLGEILRRRPPAIGGFPPVLMKMIRLPAAASADWSFVKSVSFGGAPLAPRLAREIGERLGAEVFTGYSCTETLIISATLPTDPPERREGTVGRPTPGVEIAILDERGGVLAANVPGRIAVRSPATMRGYWRNPEATARAIGPDGWLRTEDMGFLDDAGYLHLLGREKEMYFRAAFNVYPGEVEEVLVRHGKVAQAAVLGVPDDELGAKGWAFVVPRDPADPPTLDELRRFVGEELASYKRPDGLTVVDEIPLNAMLKVDKLELRNRLP